MPTTFYAKRNDTGPEIEEILSDEEGIINLTGCTVRFHLRALGSDTVKVDEAASVVNAATGHVKYEWGATDLDTSGHYLREWEVTFPSGKIVTVPNAIRGYAVRIRDDIA